MDSTMASTSSPVATTAHQHTSSAQGSPSSGSSSTPQQQAPPPPPPPSLSSALPPNVADATARAWASTFEGILQSSPPNAPAAAPAAPTTQQVIQQRLSVDASASINDALTLLRRYEVKKIPLDLSFRDLLSLDSPWRGGGVACFDAAHAPNCGWVAHNRCKRCIALNVLMQADPSYTNSAIGQVNIATALLTTECVSQRQRTGVLPKLPINIMQRSTCELIYAMFRIVVSLGPEQVPATVPGNPPVPAHPLLRTAALTEHRDTICALLHASNVTRSSVDVFIPATVALCQPAKSGPAKFRPHSFHEAFTNFLPEAVAWYLRDVSLKKHQPLILPACTEPLLTIENKPVHHVRFEVHVVDEWKVHPSFPDRAHLVYEGSAEKAVGLDETPLTVRDVAQTLGQALRAVTIPLRCASPHWRVANVNLREQEIGVRLAIKIELPTLTGLRPKVTPKIWIFDTFERRKTPALLNIE